MRIRLLAGLVVLMGALTIFVLPAAVDAQKELTQEQKDEQISQDIKDFALAGQLTELGRKNKAPEALITAAGLLRKLATVEMATLEEQPEIEDDPNAAKVELVEAKAPDFKVDADKLFAEAVFMAKKEHNLDVAALVSNAKNRTEYRSPSGGPKQVVRAIAPKQTHSYKFKIQRNNPTSFAFRSNAPCRVSANRNDSDGGYGNSIGTWASATLYSGGLKTKNVFINIKIHNYSNISGQYQMVVN